MTNNASKPALDPAFVVRARDAYAIYQAASGGLNFQRQPCPAWDDLPEPIRINWYTIALRFREHEVIGTRPGDEVMSPPREHVFAHLPDPAGALKIWQRYMGVAELPPSTAEQASSATAPTPAPAEPSTDPASPTRWVPPLNIGPAASPPQRQRNFALYQRLRDGDPTGGIRRSGLAGFVFEIPPERMRVMPDGSFAYRLDRNDECFRRLLSVVADHFDLQCDADDERERLRARVAELEARQGGA